MLCYFNATKRNTNLDLLQLMRQWLYGETTTLFKLDKCRLEVFFLATHSGIYHKSGVLFQDLL